MLDRAEHDQPIAGASAGYITRRPGFRAAVAPPLRPAGRIDPDEPRAVAARDEQLEARQREGDLEPLEAERAQRPPVARIELGELAGRTSHEDHAPDQSQDVTSVGFKLVQESDLLRNPADDRTKASSASGRGKSDQFVLLFQKPAG
jgi:hypothetical protein